MEFLPRAIPGALAALLLLSGCGDGNETVLSRTAPEAPEATSTVAPPVPSGLDRSTPLTYQGLGVVALGITPAEVEQRSDLKLPLVYNAGPGPSGKSCARYDIKGGPLGLSVLTTAGEISRISVTDNSAIHTEAGLKIGDSAATVERLYPSARKVEHEVLPQAYRYFVNAPDAGRALGIQLDADGKVMSFWSGGSEEVAYSEGCPWAQMS